MSVSFTVDTRGLERAMMSYIHAKGKSDADTVNKAMRFVLVFAASKIKQKTPGSTAIRSELTSGKVREKNSDFKARTGGNATDARQAYLANTVAAMVIATRMRKKGRTFFPKSFGGNAKGSFVHMFYDKVQKLIAARARSANYLRAGFIPAFRKFDVPQRGPANQKRFKGRSTGKKAIPSLRGLAEAFATNQREGAYILDPLAMVKAVREVRRKFLQWVKDDINANAKRSGFF